ncbi:hypothetical protein EW145_g6325, partial [Phellinidium pouzarii]
MAESLSPIDILYLARSSKALYALLMSKQSKPIWRSARQAQRLLECPRDLSEPQFASLLFERFCQVALEACGARTLNPNYVLRLRLCKACFSAKSDFELVIEAYLSFKDKSAEQRAFVEKRMDIVKQITDDTRPIYQWLAEKEALERANKKNLRYQRTNAITNNLLDLGYNIKDLGKFKTQYNDDWNRLACQPCALTDRSMMPDTTSYSKDSNADDDRDTDEDEDEDDTDDDEDDMDDSVKINEWNTFRIEVDADLPYVMTFKEFHNLPAVLRLIEEDSGQAYISMDDWRLLLIAIRGELQASTRRAEEFFVKKTLEAHRNALSVVCPVWYPLKDIISRAINLGDLIIRGLGALYFLEGPPDGLGTYLSAFSEWSKLAAVRGHFTRVNSVNSLFPYCSGHITTCSYTLLWSLGFTKPEEVQIDELVSMGEAFVCMKCDLMFRYRMDWQSLVLHFSNEQNDYFKVSIMLMLSEFNAPCTFIDIHDLFHPGQYALMDIATALTHPLRKDLKEFDIRNLQCNACASVSSETELMTIEEMEMHFEI